MSLFHITHISNLFFHTLRNTNSLNHFDLLKSYIIVSNSNNKNFKDHYFNHLFVKAINSSSFTIDSHINNVIDHKLISPSFFTRLINNYWQETIFISKSSEVSEKYTNQLKVDGMSFRSNQYKKFLLDFSKSLITGRINTYLNENQEIKHVKHNPPDVRYIWRKGFNLVSPLKKFSRLYNKRYLNKAQLSFMKQLQDHRVPIFTVTNNFNQIIVAEPSEELTYNRNLLDLMYQWYCNNVLLQPDTRPSYESLFFVNSADALEYKEHIKNNYVNYNIYKKQDALNIFPSSLDVYYKLTNTSHPKVKFYLVPDLQELGHLIYKYQYYKNVRFHKGQKYGKYYFQGQPIYMIQPIYCKNIHDQQIDLIEYFYKFDNQKKYKTLFMNYEVALIAWQKFLQENSNYKLPNEPQLLVYNLEDILKINDNHKKIKNADLIFIPNKESYNFIKLKHEQKYRLGKLKRLTNEFLYLKTLVNRLIWSLTSRQPTNLS